MAGLQLAVAALDDSGLGYSARGSSAAVVFGAAGCGPPGTDNLANRLSWALGLRGPSLMLDSGSASAAAAVDTAVRLLADESVPFVIAGGMDLPLSPDISIEDDEIGAGSDEFTVVIVHRVADARRGGIRMHAEITGVTDFSAIAGGRRIPLDLDSAHAHNDRLARLERGDEPPVLIALSGRDALEVHDTALHWAEQLGRHRSLREFAAATGRMLPGPVRAAVLGRDRDDAAAQLRSLAARIAAARQPVSAAERARRAERIEQAEQGRPVARSGRTEDGRSVARSERTVQVHRADRHERSGWREQGDRRQRDEEPQQRDEHREPQQLLQIGQQWRAPARRVETTEVRRGAVTEVFGPRAGAARGGVLFLCSGSSEPYPGMGRGLAARYPVFARALMDTADAVVAAGGPRVWTPRFGFGNGGGGAEFAQAATFVYQVAMAELLARWGIRADAVVGYGTGEMAAAAVAGGLSVADAARVVVEHSRIAARADHAATAVLEATATEAIRLVEPMRAAIAVAAIDSPRSVTVAGEARYIDALVRRAHRRTIFAQRLADQAGARRAAVPGPRYRELAPLLVDRLAGIAPRTPVVPLYSTTRAGAVLAAEMDAGYWGEHSRGPVNLTAALEHAAAEGLSTVLEIAPHPTLTPTVREHAPFRDSTHPVAARADEPPTLLRALARLHLEGRPLDWTALGPFTTPPPPRPHAHGALRQPHAIRSDRQYADATAPRHRGSAPNDQPQPDSTAPPSPAAASGDQHDPLTAAPQRSTTAPDDEPYPATARYQPATAAHYRRHPAAGASDHPVRWGYRVGSGGVAGPVPDVEVWAESTYVVTGGLGPAGVRAVCWLLAAGASDVVLLTRAPRALPPPLDGLEDRIVLVHCDIADRDDLAHVLHDLRECGPPIRGVVHTGQWRAGAAANVLELTAADAPDFTLLVAVEDGARAELDRLAAAHGYRRVVRVDWEDAAHRVSDDGTPHARG